MPARFSDLGRAQHLRKLAPRCSQVDKTKLTAGTRVSLDMTTLTIMRMLPREVGAGAPGGGVHGRLAGVWRDATGDGRDWQCASVGERLVRALLDVA